MPRMARAAFVAGLGACGHAAPPSLPPPSPPPGDARVAIANDAAIAPIDAPPPRALDEDPSRLAAREVGLYDDLAAALTAAGDDCDAAATKIDAIVDANADAIAAFAKIARGGDRERDALLAALAPHRAHLDATMHAIATARAVQTCARNAAFAAAFERLNGAPA
jgi:hypothetical protein